MAGFNREIRVPVRIEYVTSERVHTMRPTSSIPMVGGSFS